MNHDTLGEVWLDLDFTIAKKCINTKCFVLQFCTECHSDCCGDSLSEGTA